MRGLAFAAGVGICVWILWAGNARAQKPPLLPEKDVAALANEISGETAKRNLEGIARFHRQRGSKGFHEAAELVARQLRAYGLSDVAILQFPADGKIFYGTQRSRPAWDAEEAELWEIQGGTDKKAAVEESGELPMTRTPGLRKESNSAYPRKIASYEAEPVALAEDSESADVTADLVDVGEGTKQSDYTGKDVKGKIVLVSGQPGAVQDLAVGKFGAAGMVSYAQNQKTAWWGEDENLIRWGHLDTFSPNRTFAFMVSLKTARGFKERLSRGEKITLHAVVKAGQHPGNYEVVSATIPGTDPKLKDEEIVFSCHLDHERPGANDNASGCAAILEAARTLQRLIDEKLERPARTIRFVFPPEIEGTMALVNAPVSSYLETTPTEAGKEFPKLDVNRLFDGRPISHRFKAVIHMDMVGGGPETKAVFHVTRGPMSLPSFVPDVAWAFADWVNEESYQFAATGSADYPIVAPEGGKEPLLAEYSPFTLGSDNDVYEDSSFGIPTIYLNDWPDRYIHTNFDSAANIDPTKLKRAALIGAASGYFLARNLPNARDLVHTAVWEARALRDAQSRVRLTKLDRADERCSSMVEYSHYEQRLDDTIVALPTKVPSYIPKRYEDFVCANPVAKPPESLPKWRRKPEPKGPLMAFGYDYFAEQAKAAGIATPKLLDYEGLWGGGMEYAYEVLNFADGKRNAQEIRDAVSAEFGPVPLELMVEYLKALEKIGIVEAVK